MKVFQGVEINKLIAVGRIKVLRTTLMEPEKSFVEDTKAQLGILNEAIETATKQFDKLMDCSSEEAIKILEAQKLILSDDEFLGRIKNLILDEKVNAAFAVYMAGKILSEIFLGLDNEYLRERAADILDVSERLQRILTNVNEIDFDDIEDLILVADDLKPSDTIKLNTKNIIALVTIQGSTRSHTAILAKTMNIPAIIVPSLDLSSVSDGMMGIVDGNRSSFIIDPDEGCIKEAKERLDNQLKAQQELSIYSKLSTETKGGRKIKLCANIGNIDDAKMSMENGADGIGLFRSEFLFIGRSEAPTEEEQYIAYKNVAQMYNDRQVIIRTLDIGVDKKAPFLDIPPEENPALGLRAIRVSLKYRDLFKVQLRALFRAAVYGNIHVMYPMIVSTEEIDEICEVINEVENELTIQGIEYRVPIQGIMIETPAAALISRELAKKVQFFSIGTNDLAQYTLAIDRGNDEMDRFYNPYHPAIFSLIKMVVDNAHEAGIWAGICGELSEDMSLIECFVNMGVDELSVTPSAIAKVRKRIRELD